MILFIDVKIHLKHIPPYIFAELSTMLSWNYQLNIFSYQNIIDTYYIKSLYLSSNIEVGFNKPPLLDYVSSFLGIYVGQWPLVRHS